MTTLLKGLKRTIVEQRVAAGEALGGGNGAMSFAYLKLLCQKFLKGNRDEKIFPSISSFCS